MDSLLTVPVGVVVARENIDNPWQDHVWRPIGVFLNPPEVADWREMRRGEGVVHFHAAALPLELHHKETAAYLANLESQEPAIYVVLRETPGGAWPFSVHLVTASPFDAQAYAESGFETVARVPIPGPLRALIEEFVAVHHIAEPFVKRQRQRHREEEHKFGQEPIFVLRERMRRKQGRSGDG
jgi:hypothetical protein